jgi:hypothetical protein
MTTSLVVGGIKLNVFGLEEYRSKGDDAPVSVLFSLHGRLRKDNICLELQQFSS